MAKVAVIVSTLAGTGQNKCFAKVNGREVFIRSLELFFSRDDVCATILAVGLDKAEMVKQKYGPHLAFASVKLVGGQDHFAAVAAALEKIPAEADLIIVHDAARPAVSAMQIDELIKVAARSGAALLAVPVTDPARKVGKDKKITGSADTKDLWLAQTPQVFSAKLLRQAYADRAKLGKDFADDADLLAAAGTPASVLPGSWRNIRIDSDSDLDVAGLIIEAVPKPKPKGPIGPYAEEKMW